MLTLVFPSGSPPHSANIFVCCWRIKLCNSIIAQHRLAPSQFVRLLFLGPVNSCWAAYSFIYLAGCRPIRPPWPSGDPGDGSSELLSSSIGAEVVVAGLIHIIVTDRVNLQPIHLMRTLFCGHSPTRCYFRCPPVCVSSVSETKQADKKWITQFERPI